jgi:hypothetical protein
VSAVFWCDVCYRDTEHRVDDGRRGPCLNPEHGKRAEAARPAQKPAAEQPSMFDQPPAPQRDIG